MKNEANKDILRARSGTSAGSNDADFWEPPQGETTGLLTRHVPVGRWGKKG